MAMIISALFLGLLLVSTFYNCHKHKKIIGGWFLLILFVCIALAQFSLNVGIETGLLSRITKSILDALQAFSLDAEYDVVVNPKVEICDCARYYLCLIYLLAPVCGGAFLLDIFLDLFPKLRFKIANVIRKTYIFSELNEQSLAVAKSIKAEEIGGKIIFTDVYADRSDEPKSELIAEAKSLGALCLKEDISSLWPIKSKYPVLNAINKIKREKRIFFIIDKSRDNVQELVALFDNNRAKAIGKAEIYVFSEDVSYSGLYRIACESINKLTDNSVKIYRKNMSRMLVEDVLTKYPLYLPLKSDLNKNTLNLTIIGSDDISLEMFLNSYWCGQMSDVELNINIVSEKSEEQFIKTINKINPDILESGKERSKLLTINRDETEFAAAYFMLKYVSADMSVETVEKINRENENFILKSDYIFISLGNDNANINLNREIKHLQFVSKAKNNTEIVYVVENSFINDTVSSDPDNKSHIIGDLNSEYSFERIKGENKIAKMLGDSYNDINKMNGTNENAFKKSFDYKSSYSRAMHLGYAAFSALKLRNISCSEMSDYDMVYKYHELLEADYKAYCSAENKPENFIYAESDPDLALCESDKGSLHAELRWLEHRRWNANLRARGYTYADEKKLTQKVHDCLVECYNTGRTEFGLEDKLGDSEKRRNGNVKKYDDPFLFDLLKKDDFLSVIR